MRKWRYPARVRIKRECCWRGSDKYVFRLTVLNGPDRGAREFVRGETWSRKLASEALDIFTNVYRYARSGIRFE